MWNRQREAEEARERLALMEQVAEAPNRNPPPVEDVITNPPPQLPADADAAE
jgi:ATP-binding cassette subfamily B protein